MKIYREIGSLYIVNREDAEGYARPVYSIEVEEAVPIEDYRSMERTVDKLIKALAEAEPIVRCKDCRWGRKTCGNVECSVDLNAPHEYHGYDWFCPNGER